MTAMMGRPAAPERVMKVRLADNQRTIVRPEKAAHLSLIRPVEKDRADRADQKTKTLLTNILAEKRCRKKGPHRPHRPLARIGRQTPCAPTGWAETSRRPPNECPPPLHPRPLQPPSGDLPPRALGAAARPLLPRLHGGPRRRGRD